MTDRLCRCGKPMFDDRFVCPGCLGRLEQTLGDGPWLDEQLAITAARQKGIDYATMGGAPAAETPLPVLYAAVELRDDLRAVLARWVSGCQRDAVRPSNAPSKPSDDTITGLTRWLLWCVPGFAFDSQGPDAVDEITKASQKCVRLIDTKPDKWYAGPCDQTDEDGVQCGADLYAKTEHGDVTCPKCAAVYDLQARREWLLAAAEDRLADATALSRAVSWLGGERLTRTRICMWAARGRIVAKGHDGQGPIYRIGDAIDLLAADARRKNG